MSSTPAADLIDKHNAARRRIAELEAMQCQFKEHCNQRDKELLELTAENQRLRDVIHNAVNSLPAEPRSAREMLLKALEKET